MRYAAMSYAAADAMLPRAMLRHEADALLKIRYTPLMLMMMLLRFTLIC